MRGTSFITAEDVAKDLELDAEGAEEVMKWLVREAEIEGVCTISNPDSVPVKFYQIMKTINEFMPSTSNRLITFDKLKRYTGFSVREARRLSEKYGWKIRKGRRIYYDMEAVKRWIEEHRKKADT